MKYVLGLVANLALAAAAPAFGQAASPAVAATTIGPGLLAVMIGTSDFAKSTAFYSALGMKPGDVRDATRDMVWEEPTLNSRIIMTSSETAGNAPLVRGGTYLIVVTRDANLVVNRLRKAGFADTPDPQSNALMSALYLRDPDGNLIELIGPPPAK